MNHFHSALLKLMGSALLFSFCPKLPGQVTLQRRPPLTAQYVLGAGDQVVLHVTDMEDVSDKPLVVDPDGYIDIPMAGRIQAGGMTLDELRAAVAAKLERYINDPAVSVNLNRSGSQPVSIIGEVNAPGVQQLSGERRLVEVLSLAGGLKSDAGPNVLVTRQPRFGGINSTHARLDPATGSTIATFSLDELTSSKSPEDNIVIEPNDIISVPKAELIYVVGDVKKAGGFQLSTHPTLSLTKAIALAEGLTPDNAANHARILRTAPGGDGTLHEIPVDVKKIFEGKAPDVQLMADDVVYIPHSGAKVFTRRAAETAIGLTTGLLIYRY